MNTTTAGDDDQGETYEIVSSPGQKRNWDGVPPTLGLRFDREAFALVVNGCLAQAIAQACPWSRFQEPCLWILRVVALGWS